MSTRTTSPANPQKLYSGASTLEWTERNLVSILYMVGMTEADLETVSIDQIIEKIYEVYCDTENEFIHMVLTGGEFALGSETNRRSNGAQSFRHKQTDWLILLARRFWRMRQIALHEVSIGV